MSEKEPPKAPVAPEGRFQTGVDSYFKLDCYYLAVSIF
jgi:hypothetical protein